MQIRCFNHDHFVKNINKYFFDNCEENYSNGRTTFFFFSINDFHHKQREKYRVFVFNNFPSLIKVKWQFHRKENIFDKNQKDMFQYNDKHQVRRATIKKRHTEGEISCFTMTLFATHSLRINSRILIGKGLVFTWQYTIENHLIG